MNRITFITGNPHKAEQYAKLLGLPIVHQKIDLDEIQSTDFFEVALRKVEQAYDRIKRPVIVDDFGFCLEDYDNLPGPFTKFFVGSEENLEKMCRIADGLKSRRASVVSTIAYKDADRTEVFINRIYGQVADHPRGNLGLGTDRIFEPDGYGGLTRSELSEEKYDEVYLKLRPIVQMRRLMTELGDEELAKPKTPTK